MTKAKTNTGKASTKMAPGKRQGVSTKNAGAKRSATTAKSSTAKRTSARQSASGGARPSKTNEEGRPGAGSAPPRLRPIKDRQTRNQILATIATTSGVERPIVEKVTRGLAQTLTRHLIHKGSGRVEIPYLGGVLYRGMRAAQEARTMHSPMLERDVQVPARQAQSVARFRAQPTLRKIVARV